MLKRPTEMPRLDQSSGRRQRAANAEGPPRRRGAALVIAMIALLLVGVLAAELARSAVMQHEQVAREEWQIQAEWLAESGLDRAAVMLAADSEYRGEVWLPASDGSETPVGRVLIEIEGSDEEVLAIRVVADVPEATQRRVRVSRSREIGMSGGDTTNLESED
jgi:Tfp pilus assembly protein PilX